MRYIFVNLPVKSAEASKAFFAALGFQHNPQFSDEQTTSIVIDQNIIVMLLEEEKFKTFTKLPISDTQAGKEVLNALSCESKQEVDDLYNKAIAAGGQPWMPKQDLGFMYGHSFQDPDGHVWELVWMDTSGVEPY